MLCDGVAQYCKKIKIKTCNLEKHTVVKASKAEMKIFRIVYEWSGIDSILEGILMKKCEENISKIVDFSHQDSR